MSKLLLKKAEGYFKEPLWIGAEPAMLDALALDWNLKILEKLDEVDAIEYAEYPGMMSLRHLARVVMSELTWPGVMASTMGPGNLMLQEGDIVSMCITGIAYKLDTSGTPINVGAAQVENLVKTRPHPRIRRRTTIL